VPVAILSDIHKLHETGWKVAQNEHRGETADDCSLTASRPWPTRLNANLQD